MRVGGEVGDGVTVGGGVGDEVSVGVGVGVGMGAKVSEEMGVALAVVRRKVSLAVVSLLIEGEFAGSTVKVGARGECRGARVGRISVQPVRTKKSKHVLREMMHLIGINRITKP